MPVCASFPWCHDDALPAGRFCGPKQRELDRIKAGYPREVTTRRTTPTNPKPDAPNKRESGRGKVLEQRIIDALAHGEITAIELAARCEVKTSDRTFTRARTALRDAGRLVILGRGRGTSYRLAADERD